MESNLFSPFFLKEGEIKMEYKVEIRLYKEDRDGEQETLDVTTFSYNEDTESATDFYWDVLELSQYS